MRQLRALHYTSVRSTIVDALASSSVRQITVAFMFGIILGLITLATSPLVALGGMVGLILLAITFTNPEVVILVVICLASGLIPSRFNLFVDLLIGHFQVSDLLLLWLLFVVVFRIFTDKSFPSVKTPLNLPILLFYGTVLGGLATAVLSFGIDFSDATYEARMLLYYMIFFAITNLIRTRSQLVRLAHGVLAIGFLLAVTMILQSSLVGSILPVDEGLVQEGDLVRVSHPGFPVVYIVLMALVSYMALCKNDRRSLFRWIQILLMGAALFVTITRSMVVIVAMGCTLIIATLPKFDRSRFVRNVLGIACVAIGLTSLLALAGGESKLVDYALAFQERLARMFSADILAPGENLAPRWEEIRFAWEKITQHPILGIGLYTPYRPSFYPGEPQAARFFIHNAYLSLWLKTGLVGLISFLWISIVFLWRGFRQWRKVQDGFLRSIILGFTVAYLGMMLSNLVGPSMVQPGHLVIFCVILGLNESILLQTATANEDRKCDNLNRTYNTYTQD